VTDDASPMCPVYASPMCPVQNVTHVPSPKRHPCSGLYIVFLAPIVISLVLTFHALRMRGWDRMSWLLGAFAIAALPFSCPLVPGIFNLFSGGIVYLIADLTLLALFVRGLRAAR
jgi:hypothetical protein